MKDIFEDLHWKCPDVILHVEISLRALFDKNVKAFEKYIEDKKLVLSSWEADGRYDVHMTVKITQLEKACEEIKIWCDTLLKKGFVL